MKLSFFLALAVAVFRFPLNGARAQECGTLNGVASYVAGIMNQKQCDVIMSHIGETSSRRRHSHDRGIPGKRGAKGEKGEPCTNVQTPNGNTETVTSRRLVRTLERRLNECETRLTNVENSLQNQQIDFEERLDSYEEMIRHQQVEIEDMKQKQNSEDFTPVKVDPPIGNSNPTRMFRPPYCINIAKAGITTDGIYRLYRGSDDISGTEVYCRFDEGGKVATTVYFNCMDVKDLYPSHESGIRQIMPNPSLSIFVWCEIDLYGWTVIQRRFDGSLGFNRNFEEFQNGFGSLKGEFWLGLQNIYELTRNGSWRLRVEIETYDNETAYAEYSDFSVGPAPGFTLSVRSYSGTAGNSMSYNNGQNFTTFDRDQDIKEPGNCGRHYSGGWWYHRCGHSNLNSFHYGDHGQQHKGVTWYHLKHNWDTQLKKTLMKIKPNL